MSKQIDLGIPFTCRISIEGISDLLFHKWSYESIEDKARAGKGSKTKKTDDLESYIYRNEEGYICLPGEYLRMPIIHAAKFVQDPRSKKKTGMDLCKAALIPLTKLASLGKKEWDYIDMRRVVVQRSGITRHRPAFKAGWKATIDMLVNIPEYFSIEGEGDTLSLRQLIEIAGKVVGTGDFRPTFGRFKLIEIEKLQE